MKQVLFIGAGHHFPQGPYAFLQSMEHQERIHARGLFFLEIDYAALAVSSATNGSMPVMIFEDKEIENIADQKTLFARGCEQYNIRYDIHDNDLQWDKDLFIKESRFADLILISGELFYAGTNPGRPNALLHEALHGAECPVLVVPENYTQVQRLFMAYDGSRESLYAIKQFCYLFPELTDLPTEILHVKEEAGDQIPDLEYLKRFTRLKFGSMGFSKLHFNAAEYFATWISEKKNVLLVSGSFGRSSLHYATKRSFSEDVIHEHKLPVFIAHP